MPTILSHLPLNILQFSKREATKIFLAPVFSEAVTTFSSVILIVCEYVKFVLQTSLSIHVIVECLIITSDAVQCMLIMV